MSQKPFHRTRLNQTVSEYVKKYILEHRLNGGDSLPPETQLAQQLGVSRGSVREGVKALESLGIVEVRHGNGLFVREYNFDSILETLGYGMSSDTTTLAELAEIRFLLEGAVIEVAVQRIEPKALARLEELLRTWQARINADEPYLDMDEEFHRVLCSALNNQTLLKLFEVFWIAFENVNIPVIREDADAVAGLEEHRAILAAVKAGDAPLARQRLLQHFRHLQGRIRRAEELAAAPA